MSKKIQQVNEATLYNYLSYVSKIKMLTHEEENTLALEWVDNRNQSAAQKLMVSYLPLVVKIAYSYKNYGQPMLDIISEGNIGLMKAVYKFDPTRGFRLSTYAMWWIKAYITDYILNTWSLVKAGTSLGRKKLFFSIRKLKQKLGITTSELKDKQASEIAKVVDVSVDDVKSINNMLEKKDVSLEATVSDGSSSALTYSTMLISHYDDPEASAVKKQESKKFKLMASKALSSLNPRERLIMTKRYLSEKPMSLNEIGQSLNISRERVRQIEKRALEKAKSILSTLT